MFERPATYEAYFLPGPEELPTDEGLTLGLQWLLQQPGRPLVLLSAKRVLQNNRLLGQAVSRHGIAVAAPPRIYEARWRGGSILAPWASERALLGVDDLHGVKAVCVIEWSRGDKATWIAGHRARDLRVPDGPASAGPDLHPVVVVAMAHASHAINHNNALGTDAEKAYVVRTLQELVRAGYDIDVEDLVAWATANGWYPAEIPRLRVYATKVKDGRRLVLRDGWGPSRGAATEWAKEAGT